MSLVSVDLDPPPTPRALGAAENALLRRIDLTTLRLFIAVCEEKNLTRAAAREGIAASAVSKRMNDFETAFGISLFERLSKGMALTPAGEALLHHARVTLLNVEKIAVELAEYRKGVRGHVRMLANLSAIVQFLPEDLSGFFSAHGLLRVDLQERPSGQVVRGIEEGAAEIGICSAATETRRLQTFHYRYDNLVVVVRPDHPLHLVKGYLSPRRWISIISACMPRVRFTCGRNTPRPRPASRCGCASTCRGSMRCAAWCRPIWASA